VFSVVFTVALDFKAFPVGFLFISCSSLFFLLLFSVKINSVAVSTAQTFPPRFCVNEVVSSAKVSRDSPFIIFSHFYIKPGEIFECFCRVADLKR
jgi:hypothetical protein